MNKCFNLFDWRWRRLALFQNFLLWRLIPFNFLASVLFAFTFRFWYGAL